MKYKRIRLAVLAALLLVMLTGCEASSKERLFQEHFADPPKISSQNAPSGITPALDREEEILAVCRQAEIDEPVLPSAKDTEGAVFHQASVTVPLEEGDCRVTYFLYASETSVYSLWIEACPQVDGCYKKENILIYPASATREQIKEDVSALSAQPAM